MNTYQKIHFYILFQPQNEILVILLSILRAALVPVLLFCNLSSKHHTSVLFNNDWIYILVISILAASNGYLLNICIIMLPK